MKQLLENSEYGNLYRDAKNFSCGCRDWILTAKDKKVEKDFSEERFKIIHECSKIKVWQAGLVRAFTRNG